MTVNATFTYTVDTAGSGQADSCVVTWGGVHGMGLQGAAAELGGGRARAGVGATCWQLRNVRWLANLGTVRWLCWATAASSTFQLPQCSTHPTSRHLFWLNDAEVTDAFDIWMEATGSLHAAECEADDALRAAVEAQLGGGAALPRGPAGRGRAAAAQPLWLL